MRYAILETIVAYVTRYRSLNISSLINFSFHEAESDIARKLIFFFFFLIFVYRIIRQYR